MVFILASLPWTFLILSTVILLFIPWIHKLSSSFEAESRRVSVLINILLVTLVMHHILIRAYSTSGAKVFVFASSGFLVSWFLSRLYSRSSSQWPVLPTLMAFVVGAHGLFDGLAFRVSAVLPQPDLSMALPPQAPFWSTLLPFSPYLSLEYLGAITLALAVMLHRIPESLLIWKLTSKLISSKAAALTLLLLAITTILGFTLSDEILSRSRPVYVHLSYLQVFIAGTLLHATWHHFIKRKSTDKPGHFC